MRRLSGDASLVALIAVAVALIFADVVFLGSGFYVRDVVRDYLPSRFVFRRLLLGGELPLWNPWWSAGQPLAANPGFQAFYPGTWLALLPDFFYGFHLEVVAHVALGAVGMFALLRTLALRRAASLFGATSFALGGALLSLTNLLPFLTSVAWWPLIVLAELRVTRRGSRRDVALFALVLAMLLLAGEQSVMIQTAILIVSVAMADRRCVTRARAGALAMACAAAVLIAAVQLVPALALKRASSRAQALPYDEVTAWSMPLDRPLELFRPHAFGRITDDALQYGGRARYRPPRLPLIFSIYCGVAMPLLVIGGMFTRAPWRWWAAALALLSYALAIGGNGPLVRWLYELRLWPDIRYPEKFVLFGLFAMIVFAAIVLDRLDHRIAALVLVVTLGDVALHVGELAPRMPRRFFTETPPVVSALRGEGRLLNAAAWPGWREPLVIPPGEATYWSERDALLPFLPALYGIRGAGEIDINLTNLQPTADYVQSMWELRARGVALDPVAAMANVEWVLLPARGGVRPLRVAGRPRYEFADAVVRVGGRAGLVRAMSERSWSPRVAFVASDLGAMGDGEVMKVVERASSIDLDVRVDRRPALLHVRFTPDRHWRPFIDGVPAKLITVNAGFAGVVVPAGTHRVALRYRDPLLGACAALSLLALAAAIMTASLGRV